MIQLERILLSGSTDVDAGITDLASISIGTETYIYSISASGGVLAAWQLEFDGSPVLHHIKATDLVSSADSGLTLKPFELTGEDYLLLNANSSGSVTGYNLQADGTIGESLQIEISDLKEPGVSVATFSSDDAEFIVFGNGEHSKISTYRVEPSGAFTEVDSELGRPGVMDTVVTETDTLVVSTDLSSHSVVTYKTDTDTGELTRVDNSAATSNLALNTPSSMEVVQAHGSSWILVAGSGSNTISVLQLGTDGSLSPTDHILDTTGTKFNSVNDIAVATVGDHVFVVAGGEDDGLSLFALVPGGHLVHLHSLEETSESDIGSVDALSVAQVGNELQIFSASEEEVGITQLSVSLEELGDVIKGDSIQSGTSYDDILSGVNGSTLLAGDGNDILVAGSGTTVMTGGEGEDIFVVQNGSRATMITDFEVGSDKLDLSDFGLLRFPNQLDFTPTADGAEIDFLVNSIVLKCATGGPLYSSDVLGDFFDGPTRLPNGPNESAAETISSPGVTGSITVSSEGENPGIQDAEVHFIQGDGSTIVVQADSQGQFDLQLSEGLEEGSIEIIKTYSTQSQDVNSFDALQVLRMSVGMDPTWGPAQPENFIAADINEDGVVNATDALDILRIAVGLPVENDPEWVFIDAASDLSEVTVASTGYDSEISLAAVDGSFSVETTSILLGNVEQI